MPLSTTFWSLQLINASTMQAIDDDAGVYNVLTADDPSEVTLYSDRNGTSANNPGTLSNGRMEFFTLSSVASVDISVQTANGHAFFLQGVTPSVGRILVDPFRMKEVLVMPYQVVGASETVVDTGFDILSNMLVKDVFVHVTTAGTGGALAIGTSTTIAGFASGVSVGTTGYPVTLLDEALVSGSSLIGSLLANTTGTDVRKLHRRANATSGATIAYQNTTSSSTAGEGYIFLTYLRIPTTAG
jgi:hypothetical protein